MCELQVTALDIFPADLPDQPDNLTCEVWNLNDRLIPTYTQGHYDLIHSRCVSLGLKKNRWPSYIRELRSLLREEGWVQLVEYYYIIQSDSGRLTSGHALQEWGEVFRAAIDGERDPRVGRQLGAILTAAGSEAVEFRSYSLPIGDWPAGKYDTAPITMFFRLFLTLRSDESEKEIGRLNRRNVEEMLYSHGAYVFMEQLRWSEEKFKSLIDRARAEMTEHQLRLYIPLSVFAIVLINRQL